MVYRFKSPATGDLVMLSLHGKRLLEILGKDTEGPGILLLDQMPAAVAAIHQAVLDDEAEYERNKQEALEKGEPVPDPDRVSLRSRLVPFLEMVAHSQREGVHIVWGL
jgi:hypothetical protein